MENIEVKKILLEKIKRNELPLFYLNPSFPSTDKDPSILFLKEIEVKDYRTKKYQIPDLQISRPICKSIKI